MSCFIVDQNHINYLVNSIKSIDGKIYISRTGTDIPLCFDPNDEKDLQVIGQVLTEANYKSYNHRYNESGEAENYKYKIILNTNPVQTLKAINCYEYQSCEAPGFYDDSIAYKLCNYIKAQTIRRLSGYDAADWEITRDHSSPNAVNLTSLLK